MAFKFFRLCEYFKGFLVILTMILQRYHHNPDIPTLEKVKILHIFTWFQFRIQVDFYTDCFTSSSDWKIKMLTVRNPDISAELMNYINEECTNLYCQVLYNEHIHYLPHSVSESPIYVGQHTTMCAYLVACGYPGNEFFDKYEKIKDLIPPVFLIGWLSKCNMKYQSAGGNGLHDSWRAYKDTGEGTQQWVCHIFDGQYTDTACCPLLYYPITRP